MTSLLIKLFIKNTDTKSVKARASYGSLGSVVGILSNILLCIIKLGIGIWSASLAIIADGLNNLADMGSSLITMLGFKLAGKPADREHPFGHGRFEYVSAFIIAFLILIVGFEMLTSSIKTLISGTFSTNYSIWTIVALAVSILIKLWMFFFNRKISRIIDSSALAATASDSLNDCISTSAVLVATIISHFVTVPFNLDAVMAIGVSLFILWSGLSSVKETLNDILGTPPQRELIEEIEQTILSFESFLGIHDLIVHNYGPGRQFASVHVEVPHNIDIVSCHEQIDICEKLVGEKTGVNLVIHMDPIDTDNETVGKTKEQMIGVLKSIDERLTLHDFRMTPAAQTRTNLVFDVVIPSPFKMTTSALNDEICARARQIDSTYTCVITFDSDFTG